MASRSATARPAARKGQASAKQTKTMAKKTQPKAKAAPRRLEPIIQTVERSPAPKPAVELPKLPGELPVPVATFYF